MAQDKGGVSATKLSNQLGIRYETVLGMLMKLRAAMGGRDENLVLAGHIEIDEAFFGGKLKNKKPGTSAVSNKQQVLVLVENEGRYAGNLVMKVIESSEWEQLNTIFQSKIESEPPCNSFRTDGLIGHSALIGLGELNMEPIPKNLLDVELPNVSLAITHAKRFLMGTYHHYCKHNLQPFLDEFCYRWNRRGSSRQQWSRLAHRLIAASALHAPIKMSAA